MPEDLDYSYRRSYGDLYVHRHPASKIDDHGNVCTLGQMYSSAKGSLDLIEASMNTIDEASKERLKPLYNSLKNDLNDIYNIDPNDPEAETKRQNNALNMLASFSPEPKENRQALDVMNKNNIAPSTKLNDSIAKSAMLSYMLNINDLGGNKIDPKSFKTFVEKNNNIDYESIKSRIQTVTPADKSIVAKIEPNEHINLNNTRFIPNTASMAPEAVKLYDSIKFAVGSVNKNFSHLERNLPEGMSKFDMIFVNGKSIGEMQQFKNIRNPETRTNAMSVFLLGEMKNGGKRIQACQMDEKGKISEPLRVKTEGLPFEKRPMTWMQTALNKVFGAYKYLVNGEACQDKVYKDYAKNPERANELLDMKTGIASKANALRPTEKVKAPVTQAVAPAVAKAVAKSPDPLKTAEVNKTAPVAKPITPNQQ